MKLPTLTAITLAAAVMAVPAFAANTPAANAAGTATVVPPNNNNNNNNDHANLGSANNGAASQNSGVNALANKTLIEKGTLPAPAATANASVAPAGTAPNMQPNMQRTITVAVPNPNADAAGTQEAAIATAPAPGVATTTPGLTNNPIGLANVKPNANNNNNAALPHKRNPVLADNGLPRAGKVIGSNIFDNRDKQVGSIDDILMGENGRPDMAVVNVNNADKKVLVPFRDFVFGNTKISDDNQVILPNQTQASLARLAAFNYHANNNNNNNAVNNQMATATGTSIVAPTPGVNGAVAGNGAAPAAVPATPGATANATVVAVPNQNGAAHNGGAVNNGVAYNNNRGIVNNNNNTGRTVVALPGQTVSNNPIGTATVATVKGNNGNNTNNNNALPHNRNPVLADNGLPRASKVIGSGVFDLANKKVGSVDGILMGVNGQPDQAVIDVRNGNKKVLVPFNQLIFGNTNITDNNRVILPNQTNAALATLPTFNYHQNNA